MVFETMTEDLFGKLIGDKGYISKALTDLLWCNGVHTENETAVLEQYLKDKYGL
jgi:hypothetical protein